MTGKKKTEMKEDSKGFVKALIKHDEFIYEKGYDEGLRDGLDSYQKHIVDEIMPFGLAVVFGLYIGMTIMGLAYDLEITPESLAAEGLMFFIALIVFTVGKKLLNIWLNMVLVWQRRRNERK